MNQFQKKFLETYGGGDYAHWVQLLESEDDNEDGLKQELREGDTLALFLWIELGDDGEPMTAEIAAQRMNSAADQLQDMQRQVQELE